MKAEGKPSAADHAKDQEMLRTTVLLPKSLHQHLKRAGGTGGASEEIRRRLEKSVAAEKSPFKNIKTRNLLIALTFVAEKVALHFGDWSEDPFSFAVMKAALNLWLDANRPEGEVVMKPNPNREPFASFFAPGTSHENVARFILTNLTWLQEETRASVGREELIRQLATSITAEPGEA
jgi:hypothetical protein